jgi:site-specific DNA-methyltransferase (cytosine-N4-specific)
MHTQDSPISERCTQLATRLSRLHPYPAMVADELALDLVRRYLPNGSTVLDPFCGSGRLLAAAANASLRVGVDTNPLACLITNAKLANANADVLIDIISQIENGKRARRGKVFGEFEGRQVDWFSPIVLVELERIVGWINTLNPPPSERLIVAAALSATVREVSYARQVGWKLHRLSQPERDAHLACPWTRIKKRLEYCVADLRQHGRVLGEHLVQLGRVDAATSAGTPVSGLGPYDAVLTSPPYGDSRTTVQYGAASALCLGVVKHINGLENFFSSGNDIDKNCLGGRSFSMDHALFDIKKYWSGARNTKFAVNVNCFLSDYLFACESLARNVRSGGLAILVVGRRSTGGFRVKLDDFTVDCLENLGLELETRESRPLRQKRVPRRINRFGRSASPEMRKLGSVVTMGEEIILVMRKR